MARHTTEPMPGKGRLRAHIVVPEELLRDVDELVGPRRRSEFFAEAAREKVAREKLRKIAHKLVGSLRDVDTPGWETPEATSAWVRSLRREADERAFSDDRE